jgi:hypothetical protein
MAAHPLPAWRQARFQFFSLILNPRPARRGTGDGLIELLWATDRITAQRSIAHCGKTSEWKQLAKNGAPTISKTRYIPDPTGRAYWIRK